MISIAAVKTRPLEAAREAMGGLLDSLAYRPSKPRVLVKPNIVDALPPRAAVDTDPAVVAGLILALEERGATEFTIGENSGYFSSKPENFERLLKASGYSKVVASLRRDFGVDVEVVNLEFAELEEREWALGTIKLPVLARTHAYIDVAKMKTHLSTGVTLSVKNQKGLLLLADKKKFHLGHGGRSDLHASIRALGQAVRPELAVVDATRALEGTGPTEMPDGQTRVRRLGLVLAGTDAFEVDNACCRLMGIPLSDVPHLVPREVTLAPGSLPLEPADPPFRRPAPYTRFGNVYLHTSMWACTGCQMAFSRTMRKMTLVPELTEKLRRLQEKYPRIDIFQGKNSIEEVTPDLGKVVFFGNCTKKLAEKLGETHVPGCSPDHNEAIEILLNL
ncbi:MAG: DUF362 domain-containing protein [Promethearchaeota archaeon]